MQPANSSSNPEEQDKQSSVQSSNIQIPDNLPAQPPSTSRPKFTRNKLIKLLAVVLLASASFAGVYYWHNKHQRTNQQSPASTNTANQTTSGQTQGLASEFCWTSYVNIGNGPDWKTTCSDVDGTNQRTVNIPNFGSSAKLYLSRDKKKIAVGIDDKIWITDAKFNKKVELNLSKYKNLPFTDTFFPGSLSWSADSKYVLIVIPTVSNPATASDQIYAIAEFDTNSGQMSKVVFQDPTLGPSSLPQEPIYTPDGRTIIFRGTLGSPNEAKRTSNLYAVNADGKNLQNLGAKLKGDVYTVAGNSLYTTYTPGSDGIAKLDINKLSTNANSTSVPAIKLLSNEFLSPTPAVSNDSKTILFVGTLTDNDVGKDRLHFYNISTEQDKTYVINGTTVAAFNVNGLRL